VAVLGVRALKGQCEPARKKGEKKNKRRRGGGYTWNSIGLFEGGKWSGRTLRRRWEKDKNKGKESIPVTTGLLKGSKMGVVRGGQVKGRVVESAETVRKRI